jgi:hypothetical protein
MDTLPRIISKYRIWTAQKNIDVRRMTFGEMEANRDGGDVCGDMRLQKLPRIA